MGPRICQIRRFLIAGWILLFLVYLHRLCRVFSPISSSSSAPSHGRIGATRLMKAQLAETRGGDGGTESLASEPSGGFGGSCAEKLDARISPMKLSLERTAEGTPHTYSSIVTHIIPSMPTTTTTHPTTTHPPRTKLSRTTQNMVSDEKGPLVSDIAFPLLRATTSSIPFASTIAVAISEEAIADREVVSAGHSGEGSAGWVASCVKGIEGEDSRGMGEMTASMSGGNGGVDIGGTSKQGEQGVGVGVGVGGQEHVSGRNVEQIQDVGGQEHVS